MSINLYNEMQHKLWSEMYYAYHDLSLKGEDELIKEHVESVLGVGSFNSQLYTTFCNNHLFMRNPYAPEA